VLTTPHRKTVTCLETLKEKVSDLDRHFSATSATKEGREDGSLGSGMWGYGLDLAGSGYGQVAGICECGNEPSGSIKCGKFLD